MKHGGLLLTECLINLGARHCFGVPGESYLALLDGLYERQDRLSFILCRHEGGAGFMAEAYGKLTGTAGICLVTRGPGATNATIAVHTATQNSTPMLLFIGQVNQDFSGREAFQEIDYRISFADIAKEVIEITDVNRIPELVSRAWVLAHSGRPGPVIVVLPQDMLAASASRDVTAIHPVPFIEAAPAQEALDAVSSHLQKAERPLLLVGGGGWSEQGRVALKRWAENWQLPSMTAFRYHDIFDNHSPCYVGNMGIGICQGLQDKVKQSDCIIALNVRFDEMTTRGYQLFDVPKPNTKLIHIHGSASELGKIYIPDISIHASPNNFAQSLAKMSDTQTFGQAWQGWCRQLRQIYEQDLQNMPETKPVALAQMMRSLGEMLPKDAILTNGAGNFSLWPNRYWQFTQAQRLLAPQSGAMGYGLPAAIAAKIAEPEKTVICFTGDGDFQMSMQELGTAMQQQAQPIIILANNGSYGTIAQHQDKHYPARVFGTELHNPDFVTLAQSYGFHAQRVERTEDFADALTQALASDTGALLELMLNR